MNHRTNPAKLALCGIAFLFCGVVGAAPSHRQDPALARATVPEPASGSDSIIVGGRIDDLRADSVGGGGTVDLVHTTEEGNVAFGGVAGFDVGDTRWGFGKLGGAYRPRPFLILLGEINYGSGGGDDGGFSYFVGKAGFYHELLAKRFYLKLEDQYYNIANTEGHLLKGGALLQVTPWLSADFDYAESVSGNLNTSFVLGRLDFYSPWGRFLCGVASGRSTPEIFDGVVRREADPQDTLEVFAGIAIPISYYEITLAVSHLDLEPTSKTPLTLSIKYSF